jgi:hypothetical protein
MEVQRAGTGLLAIIEIPRGAILACTVSLNRAGSDAANYRANVHSSYTTTPTMTNR